MEVGFRIESFFLYLIFSLCLLIRQDLTKQIHIFVEMGAQHQWKLWEEPLDPCLCYKGSKTRRGEAPGRCCTFYLLSDLLPCNSFKNYVSISNCWARRRVNRKPKRFCELWVLFHVARSGGGGTMFFGNTLSKQVRWIAVLRLNNIILSRKKPLFNVTVEE